MADIQYGRAVDADDPAYGSGVVTLINWLGALVSVTLIAGLAWWGYQLLVRDVSGVPVVRALEGPMRIAPEDPGGVAADHQGLAVNNIPAEGTAAPPADRVVLAPKPTVLTDEDETIGELSVLASPELEKVDATVIVAASDHSAATTTVEETAPALEQPDAIQAALLAAQGADTPDVVPASVAGVANSVVPVLRPAVVRISAVSPTVSNQVFSIDPDDIPAGTRLAQLGAFETEAIAEAQWAQIVANFEDYMDGKARVIQRAQSGGKVFYRLRAHGFTDLSDARRFCSALMAGKANCIPVVTR